MNEKDIMNSLTDINSKFIDEAISTQKPAIKHTIKRKTALLIAAVLLILLATGSAWFISSLSVEVENLGITNEGYAIDIPETDIPEDLRHDLEELDLLTSEEMTELEREHSVYMFGFTRLEHIAENYGYTHKGRVFYEYIDNVGGDHEKYCETGAFYDDEGKVFVFCHTNDKDFESHVLVCLLYSNPETKEAKYEHVIFEKSGAYYGVIADDEGWNLEGAFMEFDYKNDGFGGHSGLIPGGNLTENDYADFMSVFSKAQISFSDYVEFGTEFEFMQDYYNSFIDIQATQNYDELFEAMRESGLYTDEQISEDERNLSIIEYGKTRLPQLAKEYNFEYKHLGNYWFREAGGHFAEIGCMYSDTEVLVFLHTDNKELESETMICLILYNPETSESKWEKVIIPHTGAYATTIDVLDGWIIENIYTGFFSEIIYTYGGGGEESFLPTGEPNYPMRDTYMTKDVWDAIWREIYGDEELNAVEDYWLPIYLEE